MKTLKSLYNNENKVLVEICDVPQNSLIDITEDQLYAVFCNNCSNLLIETFNHDNALSLDCYVNNVDDSTVKLGLFRKLNSKFDDCSFFQEKDIPFISNLLTRYDVDKKELKLGDLVMFKYHTMPVRIIWSESEFSLYSDSHDEIIDLLSVDCPLTKIN